MSKMDNGLGVHFQGIGQVFCKWLISKKSTLCISLQGRLRNAKSPNEGYQVLFLDA
jgi:hypothetical protein